MTDFLTKKKKENKPTDFASWIRKYGTANTNAVTPDRAATLRAKSAPTYGKNAEWLSENGLLTSGYARYLSETAERDFSAAKQKYAADEAAAKEKNLSGYARYLTSHEDKQSSLHKQMIDSIGRDESFNLEDAYQKAIAAGLTDENARSAAELGVATAKKRITSRLLELILKDRLSKKRVEDYARAAGFSDEEVERFGLYAQVIGGSTFSQIFDKTN